MEKKIILRLTDDSILAINPMRAKGIDFELVKGMMTKLTIFGNVDAS